jgi:hypothetical protein
MIRLTCLQFRTQSAAATCGVLIAALVAAATGPHLAHLYSTTVATCRSRGDCDTAIPAFLATDATLRTVLGGFVRATPAILGAFWGAPLVARELESGTYRLAWTQSVTRTRWLAVKLAIPGLTAIAATALLTLIVSSWANPLDRAHRNQYATFDQRDLVPIGYAAFAFALGVTAGLLIRRTLPAIVAALAAFAAARIAFTEWLRPHLFTAAHTSLPLDAAPHAHLDLGRNAIYRTVGKPSIPNAWVFTSRLVDKAGRLATPHSIHRFLEKSCALPTRPLSRAHGDACFARINSTYHLAVTYLPATRYWPLQALETTIFLAAALTVTAYCLHHIHTPRYA